MGTEALKDSGERREFSTGSQRDQAEGKGRFDLLSMIALAEDAKHMELGANKYQDRNWEKGQPLSQYINSAFRHLVKLAMGLTDEPHANAAVWNLNGYRHTKLLIKMGQLPASLDDMPGLGGEALPQVAAELWPADFASDDIPGQGVLFDE